MSVTEVDHYSDPDAFAGEACDACNLNRNLLNSLNKIIKNKSYSASDCMNMCHEDGEKSHPYYQADTLIQSYKLWYS